MTRGAAAPLPSQESGAGEMEKEIFLQISGAVSPTGVFLQGVHLTVTGQTGKAVKFRVEAPGSRTDQREFWLPRRAIKRQGEGRYRLLSWFEPNRFQSWIFENAQITGFSFTPIE